MGCVLISFFMTLVFHSVLTGLAYPLVAAALMKLSHVLLVKFHPLDDDPNHIAIQESVVLGGGLSVVLARLVNEKLSFLDLAYGGGSMALLALLSIALEQFYVAREWRAARKAKVDAEKARRLADDGDLATADEVLQEALLTTEIAFGSHHPQVATIATYLADVKAALGYTAASTLMFRRAVVVHETLQPWSEDLVRALNRYAEHLRRNSDFDQALPIASRAVVVSRQVHGDRPPTANCLIGLAKLQSALGQVSRAYKSCRGAAEILEENLGRNHRETQRARGLVATHCVSLGRLAEGQRLLSDLMSLGQRSQDSDSHDAHDLNMLLDFAAALRNANPKKAAEAYAQAVVVFRSAVGPSYERASELLESLPAYLAVGGPAPLEQLYVALCAGDTYAARQVLREHPDLAQVVDATGWTPLQWACFFGLADVVSTLLSLGADAGHGQDEDYPALYIAARWGRHRAVADIIQKGSGVDLDIACVGGSRPLHGAVRSGDHLTFDILVSRHAKLEVTNAKGWTPLHEAAYTGHRKFLVSLIGGGVDTNAQAAPSFDTPLHAAVRGDAWLTAETLILNLARLDLMNAEDTTPMELAQELWHERVSAVLLAAQESRQAGGTVATR
jgi:ankyrin repeat protein